VLVGLVVDRAPRGRSGNGANARPDGRPDRAADGRADPGARQGTGSPAAGRPGDPLALIGVLLVAGHLGGLLNLEFRTSSSEI